MSDRDLDGWEENKCALCQPRSQSSPAGKRTHVSKRHRLQNLRDRDIGGFSTWRLPSLSHTLVTSYQGWYS